MKFIDIKGKTDKLFLDKKRVSDIFGSGLLQLGKASDQNVIQGVLVVIMLSLCYLLLFESVLKVGVESFSIEDWCMFSGALGSKIICLGSYVVNLVDVGR
jgi:hypothetical protein